MSCTIKDESCGVKCTGYEGGEVWKKIDKDVDSIPCDECKSHGKILVSGIRDVVSLGLGRKAHDPKNFDKFVKEVNCINNTCKKEGRC